MFQVAPEGWLLYILFWILLFRYFNVVLNSTILSICLVFCRDSDSIHVIDDSDDGNNNDHSKSSRQTSKRKKEPVVKQSPRNSTKTKRKGAVFYDDDDDEDITFDYPPKKR